jgi:hypothetical protein
VAYAQHNICKGYGTCQVGDVISTVIVDGTFSPG